MRNFRLVEEAESWALELRPAPWAAAFDPLLHAPREVAQLLPVIRRPALYLVLVRSWDHEEPRSTVEHFRSLVARQERALQPRPAPKSDLVMALDRLLKQAGP
jgi:hypothetical protein